jgi:hypothetical protein
VAVTPHESPCISSGLTGLVPRRRWADNIKMDLREIGWDGVEWIDMARY